MVIIINNAMARDLAFYLGKCELYTSYIALQVR